MRNSDSETRSPLWIVLSLTCLGSFIVSSLIVAIEILLIAPSLILSLVYLESSKLPLYPLIFFPSKEVRIQGLPLLVYIIITFSMLIGSIAILFARDWRNMADSVKQALSNLQRPIFFTSGSEIRLKSTFIHVAQLYALSFIYNLVLTLFLPLESQFNRVQALSTIADLSDRLFVLTVASVWEEVFFRILCLGIPLLGYHYLKPKKLKPKTRPMEYILGGHEKEGLIGAQVLFILISAAFFGLTHVPRWGIWKFVPTFIAGLIFGYLFLTEGLHASILFHFVGNYAEVIISFVVSLLSDGNDVVSAGLLVLGISFICMMIITGVWVTGNYCMSIIELWKKRTRTKKPELPGMK